MKRCRTTVHRYGVLLGSGLALLVGCSDLQLAGSISETTNGRVVGAVVDQGGAPAERTRVLLLPADFDPVKDTGAVATATTDTLGQYSFSRVPRGDYTLVAVRTTNGARTFISGVHVENDTYTAPTRTLLQPGSIKVYLPSGVNVASGYVYVPGTLSYSYLTEQSDFAMIDSVPAGALPAVSYSLASGTVSTVIRYAVSVSPSDTAVVRNPTWSHAVTLVLNTSAAGANVLGDVVDFPVLVRLNSGNFDFSQAQATGADIRFDRSGDSFLPCEIEQWDSAKGAAEIWVKVDTVRGNDAAQTITMYWGNPHAAAGSNGAEVFDTAAGFAGVWHLGDSGDNIHDATGNAFNGINSGSTATTGVIGNARNFANKNFIRIAGLLKSPPNVTLSAWVRYDTATAGQDIVSLGDVVLIRVDDIINKIGTTGNYHNSPIVNDSNYTYVSTGQFLVKTGWHHLVFSINTETHVQAFYIDGARCAISHDVNPIYYAGLGADTYIGMHGNGKKIFNFMGQLDEVRVNSTSLSPDWVKLCFMNQKAEDALVQW